VDRGEGTAVTVKKWGQPLSWDILFNMIFAIIGWSFGQTTEDSIGRRSYTGAILGVKAFVRRAWR
jgi:hypothetical protein